MSLRERIQFLKGPGGATAAAFWALKVLLRLDVHGFFARPLRIAPEPLPTDLRFLALREGSDLTGVPAGLVRQLDSQCGAGVMTLLARRTRVYALVGPESIACQLNISERELLVDSPIPLRIHLREGDVFLAFLYTHQGFRRRGLAERLIRLVCHSLAEEGFVRCLCHIRMTNVPSLAAFRRTGWVRVAWLVTSTGGRLLGAPGAVRTGIGLA